MIAITRLHKMFFALILVEAILVAVLGYFFPSRLATGFSWMVLPPLHARFVASIYFFGVVFMLGCFAARDWADVRWAIPLATVWTGLLFIVSIYHLDNFDFDLWPVWVWMVAYFLDPIIGLWLIWQSRAGWGISASSLPPAVRAYLLVQGVIFTLMALFLLFLPDTMVEAWPWALHPDTAQFYAGPLLAYGAGSLLFGWQGTWSQLRVAAPAMLIFTAATLIASYKHDNLFSSSDVADVLWFVGFALATAVHLLLTLRVFQLKPS